MKKIITICFMIFTISTSFQESAKSTSSEIQDLSVYNFSAGWTNKGSLKVYKQWNEPKQYSASFGIYFYAEAEKEKLAIVQEMLFVDGSLETAEKNIWYMDVGSDAERAFDYNLDVYLKGVLTGEYSWDREEKGRYWSSDFPEPIVSKIDELKIEKAHWKFKTYLVIFDDEKAIASGRWRDGVDIVSVIDWEIKAELRIDNKGEPNLIACVFPENPTARSPEPNEIQWRAMPSTKKAWHKIVSEIKKGKRIDSELNIWYYQLGWVYDKYSKQFWDEN